MAYPATKYINQCDNTFGGLGHYLSASSLDVENVIGEYSSMEIWEKVKTRK
jgi:hypothetical protein